MTRNLRVLVLLLAGLVLAACSVSRLAYLNAPPLAMWYIGGYVDLNDSQKAFAKDRLRNMMAWHRQAELPQYQHAIENLIVKMNGKVSVEDAGGVYTQARDYYHRSIEHLLPDFAQLLLTMDESQAAQMEKAFAKDIKKLVKESVDGSVDERRTARAKKYLDQFEEWTGRLSGPQREIVVDGTRMLPEYGDERIADRKHRNSEMLRIVRTKPPRDEAIAALRKIFIDTDSWRRPEYNKRLRERDERLVEVTSELSATLTPEQRASVQKKMRGYVKDISSIIASGPDGRG